MSRLRATVRLRTLPLAVGAALLLSGCAGNAPQDSLKPESHYARTIYNLIVPVFWIAGVVGVLVIAGSVYMAMKYRIDPESPQEDHEIPKQIHGNRNMELAWTAIPSVILLAVGFATVLSIIQLSKEPPKSNPHIEVIGQQWWWEFRYDVNLDGTYDEIVTANEMVIPAGTDIALRMGSRDVIHGWWVPRLQGKRDAVPGHPTDFNVAADEPGEYYGQCTVMCGLSHANMRFKVIVLSKADYAKWVEEQQRDAVEPTTELAKKGKEEYNACAGCHEIQGVNKIEDKNSIDLVAKAAPDLTHFASRTIFASGEFDLRKDTPECKAQGIYYDESCLDTANLRAWLADPPAMLPMAADGDGTPGSRRGMPNLNLSASQIDALVAYLSTLK